MNLETIVAAAFDNSISIIILISILITFFTSLLIFFFSGFEKSQRYLRSTPSILVSIGIFGTFLGIFIALLNFDTANINESIPGLLDGLKIAFVTSIEGLLFSLLFRVITLLFPRSSVKEDADVTDLLSKMTEVKDAISADNESSVITQLQKLRTDNNDHLSELKKSFAEFAKEMSENNMKALIEAIQKVMEDFNTKINDQLGDSFKELSQAVEKMVEWQQNYKDHVDHMTEQLNNAVNSVKSSEESLKSIANSIEQIPKTTVEIKELIKTIQSQVEILNDQLGAFAEMKNKAMDAMPTIEKNLDQMTNNLSEKVTSISSQMKESSELMNKTIHAQLKDVDEMINNMSVAQKEALKEINDTLINQIKGLDESMEKEVTRIIELMGTKLGSLSEKFVNDYTPLTVSLSNLVKSLGNVNSNKPKSK